jgi:hypothetical protein
MRRVVYGALALMFVLTCVSLVVADTPGGKLALKAGDEIFACDCGEKCPCDSMSRNPGKCTCGKDMVKAKVVKADAGTAELKADSWDKSRMFKTVGKFACACGPTCKCDTISQNAGQCTCGKDMAAVK